MPGVSPAPRPSTILAALPVLDGTPLPLASGLLRVHAALDQRRLWQGLRGLARDAIPHASLTLEIEPGEKGVPRRIYRHGLPHTPPEWRRDHPARGWLGLHGGTVAFRLSDIVSLRDLRGTTFHERVMRREDWEKQLGVVAWRGRTVLGTLNFNRPADQPDFTVREMRLAETLQLHFQTALLRVLAHEEAMFRGEQFAAMLEEVPVGLLLLDWELRPLWCNGEGAHACAVWNHGERRAAALDPHGSFQVPAPLAAACAEMRAQWQKAANEVRLPAVRSRVLSDLTLGVHANIALRPVEGNPVLQPAFQVQLDYRRPRGDRNRPLSPGAVALLARLSAREREVAMRVREGLRTMEIASELRRSPLTIKTQLAAIFAKLEVRSRARVAALLNR